MKKTCAWCLKDMGSIPGNSKFVSHGICGECKLKFESDNWDYNIDLKKWEKINGGKNEKGKKESKVKSYSESKSETA